MREAGLDPPPGTGDSLELDEEDLRELLGWILVQGPVLLHNPVQGAQLDQLGHHSDGRDALDHDVPGLQVDGVNLVEHKADPIHRQ